MSAEPERPPPWRDPVALRAVALVPVVLAASWFLLQQLAPLVRPLLIAVFLAYILMPYHARLRGRVGGPASLVLLAGATVAVLVGLAWSVYASVQGLSEQLPGLQRRAVELMRDLDGAVSAQMSWLGGPGGEGREFEERVAEQGVAVARPVLNAAADVLLEAAVVGLYLMFLLFEGSTFPDRVRRAYGPERAGDILHVAGQVNSAIVSYLKAKVKASLVLSVPVGLTLWALGVKFALLWAVLTFLCNFIPYIGTVVAYSLPVGFAFLQFGPRWEAFAVGGVLLGCHILSASVVEPTIIGKAVGLSPLVVLGSLAFWGLLWGLPGMFLAVPLTAVAVIVMDHFPFTRPAARLLGGG